jgi:hypothetical protein
VELLQPRPVGGAVAAGLGKEVVGRLVEHHVLHGMPPRSRALARLDLGARRRPARRRAVGAAPAVDVVASCLLTPRAPFRPPRMLLGVVVAAAARGPGHGGCPYPVHLVLVLMRRGSRGGDRLSSRPALVVAAGPPEPCNGSQPPSEMGTGHDATAALARDAPAGTGENRSNRRWRCRRWPEEPSTTWSRVNAGSRTTWPSCGPTL